MKIAMVSQSYYPSLGGVTEHVHHLCGALRSLGHQVTIITAGHHNDGRDRPGEVIRIGRNALFPINGALVNVTVGLRLRKRLENVFRCGDFDIIHIHSPLEPTLPLAALTAAGSVECPVVGTFHMSAGVSPAYEVFSEVLRTHALRLDARIAVSHAARSFAMRYFPGEYMVVPNGVAFSRFAGRVEPVRKLADGRTNILFVGRLDIRKRAPLLISAFKMLRREHPGSRLVIVGKGFMEPACRAAAYPLTGKDIVFVGRVSPSDLPSYYGSSDIFSSVPAGSESFGIVLLEAMAAGLPIVATRIEGYREVVTDGVDGILVKPGDTAGLAGALGRLVRDSELRTTMGRMGQKKAILFDWPRIARRIADIYADLHTRPVYRRTCEPKRAKSIRLL
ncbi:MAG: glycosyltransferase family 4 protein [Candidatus Eisenbacteria bacterium]